jgi:hypothetical protein
MRRTGLEPAAIVMLAALGVMVALPFVAPAVPAHRGDSAAPPRAPAASRSAGEDGVIEAGDSRKGQHGHDLDPAAPHWYVTVHGDGPLADVFALDATGRVIGGILGGVPSGPDSLQELRGMCLVGDGRLAVVNAYMQNSRVLLFGPPDARDMRPFQSVWVQQGPANPGLVHPYQIVTAPDGTLYASNQDTNTVTRYRGLGSPQMGQPVPVPPGLAEFGTLPPGTIVPNSQHSPEGIHEVRGIAFGPDGLLYVADRTAQQVVAFDTTTGRRAKVVLDKSAGLGHPIQLLFTPDGQSLLVGDNLRHCVWRVALTTGRASPLVAPGAGGLNAPSALALDGSRLLVGSRLGKSILAYRLADGTFEGVFARLQSNPEFLISTRQR